MNSTDDGNPVGCNPIDYHANSKRTLWVGTSKMKSKINNNNNLWLTLPTVIISPVHISKDN